MRLELLGLKRDNEKRKTSQVDPVVFHCFPMFYQRFLMGSHQGFLHKVWAVLGFL